MSKDNVKIPLPEASNLYLILLKFRFPPINIVQEGPNIATYIPPHADSMLLFADIVKDYGNSDWRYDFVKAAFFRRFNREYPESLQHSKEYNVPLSSVLIPILNREDSRLELYIPTKHPQILSIRINKDLATLDRLYKVKGLLQQEKLWIRKRDDITKLALISMRLLNIKGVISGISTKSGGYRAIDLSIKVPIEYFTTELAFFASIRNYGKLIEELNVLKISGIGKKHDMGFGDLVLWEVYRIQFNEYNIRVLDPMVLSYKEHNSFRIITLRNLPATIVNTLKQKGKLLIVNLKSILSRTRPPYWAKEELCLMPFSEFLLN